MFIGAIVFSAILFTIIITYLLHYYSKHKNFPLRKPTYQTPLGVTLIFFNSLLFSASLFMLVHKPFVSTFSAPNLLTFAHSSPGARGYYPENTIAIISPGETLSPYSRTTTITPAPSPIPAPIQTPPPSPMPIAIATPVPTSQPIMTNQKTTLTDSTYVYIVQINGQLKGYTTAFLNSITIFKDYVADTRVMIKVNNEVVSFTNLDTGEKLETEQLSQTEWEKQFSQHELLGLELEKASELSEPITLTIQ